MKRSEYNSPLTGRKIGIGCGSTIIAIAVVVSVRWILNSSVPSLTIPPKVLPSPNGFDTIRGACQMLVNTKQVSDATTADTKIPADQWAGLVASNAQALHMLRSGLQQEYMDSSARTVYTTYPYFAQERSMARLLSLEATLHARQGDWNGAVNSCLDCIEMGEAIPHGAPLIGRLVGVACEAIGRKQLWSFMDHLNANQLKAATARMESIQSLHDDFVNTLSEERYMSISSLNMLFRGRLTMRDLIGQGAGNSQSFSLGMMFLMYSKETIARNNQNYFDALIANARRPYAVHAKAPRQPTDPINQIFLFDMSEARIKDVESETQNSLLAISFALHAYRIEHGSCPSALSELVPEYLHSLPDDPFGLGGTFRYRTEANRYILYSVGPDGKDDGGKAIDAPAKTGSRDNNARYYVNDNSVGDVVAGKNIW